MGFNSGFKGLIIVYLIRNIFFSRKTFATTGKIILRKFTSIRKVIADATKYPTLIYDRGVVFFLNHVNTQWGGLSENIFFWPKENGA